MYNGEKRSQRGTGAAGGGDEIGAALRVKAPAAVLDFFFIERLGMSWGAYGLR